ncbi:hypothetical protein GCM10009609_52570 [Pseudonocardia aurantiaca]|uniref:Uncharacterized protein n=1 Tax=Pseudonocardia aurantiaca TaxID=75290 RepID=A0ABW4FLR4_9PSEU
MAQRDYGSSGPAGAPALEDPELEAVELVAVELEAVVGDDGQAEQAMTDAARDLDAERSDGAARIDASRGSDGAVAPASGRQDAGPDVWR